MTVSNLTIMILIKLQLIKNVTLVQKDLDDRKKQKITKNKRDKMTENAKRIKQRTIKNS